MVAKLADLGLSRAIKQHKTHRTTNTIGETRECSVAASGMVIIVLLCSSSG
jgi:hypothetical protein